MLVAALKSIGRLRVNPPEAVQTWKNLMVYNYNGANKLFLHVDLFSLDLIMRESLLFLFQGRGLDVSKFRIVQMDTLSSANSGVTSSSTTSEGCCAAVQEACQVLVERLTPIYQMVQAAAPDGEVQWEALISKVRQKGLICYNCAFRFCLNFQRVVKSQL